MNKGNQLRIFRNFRGYYKIFGLHGLFLALQEKATTGFKEIYINIPKLRFPISLRLNTSDIPTYKQIFLDNEYDFEINDAPNVIVDVGANIGLSSVYFANKYPKARIIAIEPEKSNFLLLEKNTKNYPNVIPIYAALWNVNTTIQVVDPGHGKWGFQTMECNEAKSSNACNNVEAITVEMILDKYDIKWIDILKIDIEGAEKEVFESSSEWIDKIGVLIVELHDRLKVGCSRSFYNATNNFGIEWHQGELVYLAKVGMVTNN